MSTIDPSSRNRNLRLTRFLALAALFPALFACSRMIHPQGSTTRSDGLYDTEFPDRNGSAQLETILHSLKKVNGYFNYQTYVFGESSRITLKDLADGPPLESAEARILTNEATSGTALVVYAGTHAIALLTCAHIVSLPDTIISWSEYSDLESNRYIHSISIKYREHISVPDLPGGRKLKILASDTRKDIALLGITTEQPIQEGLVPVFPYPLGNSDEINWGTFIYLAGYPTGQLMITSGTISKPSDPNDNLLTDASFNEGFSGGIALALRDGVPNFELVGMGRSVSAHTEYILKPEKENYEYSYNAALPYSGPVYVKQKKDINYGVTWIIPINSIREFYNTHRDHLQKEGFDMDAQFRVKE